MPDEIVLTDAGEVTRIRTDFGRLKLAPNVLVCQSERPSFLRARNEDPGVDWPEPIINDHFNGRGNPLTVVRLLAERWSATLEEVVAVSDMSDYSYSQFFHARIGTVDSKPVERVVDILRNPHVTGSLAHKRAISKGSRRKR